MADSNGANFRTATRSFFSTLSTLSRTVLHLYQRKLFSDVLGVGPQSGRALGAFQNLAVQAYGASCGGEFHAIPSGNSLDHIEGFEAFVRKQPIPIENVRAPHVGRLQDCQPVLCSLLLEDAAENFFNLLTIVEDIFIAVFEKFLDARSCPKRTTDPMASARNPSEVA